MTDTLLFIIASISLLQLLLLVLIHSRIRSHTTQASAKKTKQAEIIKRISQGTRSGGQL